MRKMFEEVTARLWTLLNTIRVSDLCGDQPIAPLAEHNRQSLLKVARWIDEEAYSSSVFRYGIPDGVKHLLDKDIGREITYSDLILCLSRPLRQRISYLELGVSVGKNFWQIANFLLDSNLTGFDIENINPILARCLRTISKTEWGTMPGSRKIEKSSLTVYHYEANRNTVAYLSGDIWDENSWSKMSGQKFNLIFSDALHDPEALLFEWQMIQKYKLLNDDEFVMVWDDLGGLMTRSFMQISGEIRKVHGLHKSDILVTRCRGWLGINESKHTIGIIKKIPQ